MATRIKKFTRPSEAADIPDLDVTPVMNLFIILIPFLISMVVFTHLAVLHFSLPPNAGAGLSKENEQPKLKITIVVAEEFLAVTYGETMLDSIVAINGSHDISTLSAHLSLRRTIAEVLSDEAVVAVRDRVKFEEVVSVMDACRSSGFSKIGLSNATDDPSKGV